MSDLAGAELTQALDRAVADYQRHYGRPRTIDKLAQMLGARQEAQRLMEAAVARIHGIPKQEAAE